MKRKFSFPKHPKIVMFGNSITEEGKWSELLSRSDIRNCGYSGYTTTLFANIVHGSVVNFNPEICFVMGGINDIVFGVPMQRIKSKYKSVLDTIVANGITTVVQSTIYKQDSPENNSLVDSLNRFLIDYCNKHDLTFLDINSKLSGNTGLKPEFTYDGLHLNEAAYDVWAEEVRSVLAKIEINME